MTQTPDFPRAWFVCPLCRSQLRPHNNGVACGGCGEVYRMVGNDIPVLIPRRDMPERNHDPLMPFNRALEIAESLKETKGRFPDLVDAYYESIREFMDPRLFEYYREIAKRREVGGNSDELCAASDGLSLIQAEFPQVANALEIGVGWGFSIANLVKNYRNHGKFAGFRMFGFDLNPASLVMAQRLFADLGIDNVHLAVANAEQPLPFPDEFIDFAFASCVVEHLPTQAKVLREVRRIMSGHSVFYFSVPNRYTLHPEPHFNVRGVGFVPRKYFRSYVGKCLKAKPEDVEFIYSYSPADLRDLMCPVFPSGYNVVTPVQAPLSSAWARLAGWMFPSLRVAYHNCIAYSGPSGRDSPSNDRGRLLLSTPAGRGKLRVRRVLYPPRCPRGKTPSAPPLDYACITSGASIHSHSAPATPAPHGYSTLITPMLPGEDPVCHYTATLCALSEETPAWFVLELAQETCINRISVEWGRAEEAGVQFTLEAWKNGQWVECLRESQGYVRLRGSVYESAFSTSICACLFRFSLSRALGQNRLLIRRFSLFGSGPIPTQVPTTTSD